MDGPRSEAARVDPLGGGEDGGDDLQGGFYGPLILGRGGSRRLTHYGASIEWIGVDRVPAFELTSDTIIESVEWPDSAQT